MSQRYTLGICLAICLLLCAVVLKMAGLGQVTIDQPSVVIQEPHSSSILHESEPSPPSSSTAHPFSEAKESAEDEHLSQLTPQMRQAIKDKLLLHGPMHTQQNSDGSISLPTSGRYTQMPVAVQMPDGSIQVKEYSVIPD